MRLDLALTIGSGFRDDDLGDDLLREIYFEHRDRYGPDDWAWWRCEDVPADLRTERLKLTLVAHD